MKSTFDEFDRVLRDIEGEIATNNTDAMNRAVVELKEELRDQVRGAGLGERLANTWRGDVYPKRGRSMTPGGYVHSRAPDIIRSFVGGATIVPVNGSKFLAIPTDAVPRARGRRGSTRRMTPEQVEAAFNQDLFYQRGQKGNVLAFVNAIASRSARGFRAPTKGRVAQGRQAKRILMFVLVPSTRMAKVLDLAAPTARAQALLASLIEAGGH